MVVLGGIVMSPERGVREGKASRVFWVEKDGRIVGLAVLQQQQQQQQHQYPRREGKSIRDMFANTKSLYVLYTHHPKPSSTMLSSNQKQ